MELSPLQTKKNRSCVLTNTIGLYTCKSPLNSERWNCMIAQCNCVLLTRFRFEHRTTTVEFGLEEITDLKSEFNGKLWANAAIMHIAQLCIRASVTFS